jgi:hypothetical protein
MTNNEFKRWLRNRNNYNQLDKRNKSHICRILGVRDEKLRRRNRRYWNNPTSSKMQRASNDSHAAAAGAISMAPHSMPAAVSAISVAPLSLNNDHAVVSNGNSVAQMSLNNGNAAAADVNSTSALVVLNTKVNNQFSPVQFENLLKHSLGCSDGEDCFSSNCARLQSRLNHAKSDCKIKNCQECSRYNATVMALHARACSNDICQVPRCFQNRPVKKSIVIDLTLD